MDFNFKKLAREAGTALSRVVQLTEEKLGTSERTELDAHFENLAERSDTTKLWTEKILANTEAVLTPNPGNRVEDYLFDKIDKKRPNRLSNLEYLGLDMIDAGNEFGPGTAYGSALIKVGQCEQKLGTTERDFIASASHCLITPLRKFLEGEMKTILRERSLLETKRLDLDACKNRVRKARSMLGTTNKEGPSPEVLLRQAEQDLRVAQAEFDRQAEITKLLLEGISSSHSSHLRCLHEFVETQVRYYSQCHQAMQELQRDLASDRKPSPMLRINSEEVELVPPENTSTSSPHLSPAPYHNVSGSIMSSSTGSTSGGGSSSPRFGRRARVLCDYDARDASELSLMSDEIINVRDPGDGDTDYYLGERGCQKGRVPRAFLEVMNE